MEKGPKEKPNILMIDEVLNNTTFQYTNYKNYNPILKHGKSIYYWKIDNQPKKKYLEMTLWGYHIDREICEKVRGSIYKKEN